MNNFILIPWSKLSQDIFYETSKVFSFLLKGTLIFNIYQGIVFLWYNKMYSTMFLQKNSLPENSPSNSYHRMIYTQYVWLAIVIVITYTSFTPSSCD